MNEQVRKANHTRAKRVKEHEKQSQKRADDLAALKARYLAEKDSPIIEDLRAKIVGFQNMHKKIAQDAVATRRVGDVEKGQFEHVYLDPAQRCAHLDKASGLQELLDYIDRMIDLIDVNGRAIDHSLPAKTDQEDAADEETPPSPAKKAA